MNGPKTDDALAAIADTQYVLLPDGRTTVCQVTMDNGFTVTGQSFCAPTTEFNVGVGKGLAFDQARDRVLELLHFRAADEAAAGRQQPIHRSAVDGKFVSSEHATANPDTTYRSKG